MNSAVSNRSECTVHGLRVVLVDSITQIRPDDAGAIIISGSHGGLSATSFALEVNARIFVFNDAGKGRDDAGIAGLESLQQQGLAACAVAHVSARIGIAEDALRDGVISAANPLAVRLGFVPGLTIAQALATLSVDR